MVSLSCTPLPTGKVTSPFHVIRKWSRSHVTVQTRDQPPLSSLETKLTWRSIAPLLKEKDRIWRKGTAGRSARLLPQSTTAWINVFTSYFGKYEHDGERRVHPSSRCCIWAIYVSLAAVTLTVKRMKAHRKVKRSVLSKRNSATLVCSISESYLVRGMSCYHSRGKQVPTKVTIRKSDWELTILRKLIKSHAKTPNDVMSGWCHNDTLLHSNVSDYNAGSTKILQWYVSACFPDCLFPWFNAIIILKSFVYSCCQRVKLVCIYRAPFELYAILCKKTFIQLNKMDH